MKKELRLNGVTKIEFSSVQDAIYIHHEYTATKEEIKGIVSLLTDWDIDSLDITNRHHQGEPWNYITTVKKLDMTKQDKETKELIESILNEGNSITLEVNSPDNKGVVINEYTTIEDNGMRLPNELLTSQVSTSSLETIVSILNNKGVLYPDITDWKDQ